MKHNAKIDLTGQQFGIWIVVQQAPRIDNKTRWLCRCTVCGAERIKRSTTLRVSTYSACNGRHSARRTGNSSPLRKISGWAAGTEVFGRYKTVAAQRGLEFSLSRDDFNRITSSDCYYCGAPPSQVVQRSHFFGEFIYNGIDRMDSSVGYHASNCVGCCCMCNVMKQDCTVDTFLAHVNAIATKHPRPPKQDAHGMSFGRRRPEKTRNFTEARDNSQWRFRDTVVALRDSGLTYDQIAAQTGISRSTVARMVSSAIVVIEG